MAGKLTTHVLDTAQGCPAVGMTVELWRVTPSGAEALVTTQTNGDGRTDGPLLVGESLVVGTYELRFDVASYFAQQPLTLPDPPFLGWVPLRFSLADTTAHYHVPLLVSPWAYSTYRGS